MSIGKVATEGRSESGTKCKNKHCHYRQLLSLSKNATKEQGQLAANIDEPKEAIRKSASDQVRVSVYAKIQLSSWVLVMDVGNIVALF